MRIIFRTDASIQIGTGHVMRCLTLADALSGYGAICTFVCRLQRGHLIELIGQRGYEVLTLPECCESIFRRDLSHFKWLGVEWATDAEQTQAVLSNKGVDWLVVDNYGIDSSWEQALRTKVCKIMAIDDMADRAHDCDLLLDQNLGRSELDYQDLVSPEAQTLIGPKYALLRPEFSQWREYSLTRRASSKLKKLLITMGGVDQGNFTCQVLNILKAYQFPSDFQIIVVMGQHAPWLNQVQTQAFTMPCITQVLVGVNNMGQLMADSDLVIGAAGGTAWEQCALGVPALLMVLAENQKMGAQALEVQGAAVVVQDKGDIFSQLRKLTGDDPNFTELRKMSKQAATLIDGNGAIRVASKILNSYA